MGMIKGQKEYDKFKKGLPLSRKGAMLAFCYECNGYEGSNADCGAVKCPMYRYMPYRGRKTQP